MWDTIKHILHHIFTGIDGESYDLGRILWAKISLVYCGLSIYDVINVAHFDPQQWAIGAGAILAGGGGSLALKAKTEPPIKDTEKEAG